MNKVFSFLLVVILVSSSGCRSINEPTLTGEILEYGILTPDQSSIIKHEPGTASERPVTGAKMSVVKTTDIIPLQKGVLFGFKWSINGFTPNEEAELFYFIRHPRMTLPNGKETTYDAIKFDSIPENRTTEGCIAYSLEEDFEMLPGKWMLAVFHKDQLILAKEFTVQKMNP